MSLIRNIGLIICQILLLYSCSEVCTKEAYIFSVNIKYIDNLPVLLDSLSLKSPEIEEIRNYPEDFSYTDSIKRMEGLYFLLSDSDIEMTSKRGTEFEFVGWFEGTEVVNEKYLIGNDDCHINLLSGKAEIIVEH